MKPVFLHTLMPVLAACGGWWLGAYSFTGASGSAPAALSPSTARATAASSDTPASALAWKARLASIPNVRRLTGTDHEIAWVKWSLQIPDAQVPQAIAALDPRRDFHALRMLYSRWAKLDFPSAWGSLLQSSIPVKDLSFYLPNDESGLSSSRLHTRPKDLIALRMIASLKASNPGQAKEFLDAFLKDSKAIEQSGLEGYNLSSLKKGEEQKAQEDPAVALQGATGPDADRRLSYWLSSDPTAAAAWFKSLPPDKQASFSFSNLSWPVSKMKGSEGLPLLLSLQGKDFQISKRLQNVAESSTNAYEHDRTYGNDLPLNAAAHAMRKWAVEDPQAALAYVQKMPANELQSMLLGQLAGQLTATDSTQAIAMINQHPDEHSLAFKGLVTGYAQQHPAECLQWLSQISDPATYQAGLSSAVRQWSKTEPALAVEALTKMQDRTKISQTLSEIKLQLHWNAAELDRLQKLAPQLPWAAAQSEGGG